MSPLSGIINVLLQFIYPVKEHCLHCGRQLAKCSTLELCENCACLLPFISDSVCLRCGRPNPQGSIETNCDECRGRETFFDAGCTVFEFSGIMKDMLHRLKYDGDKELSASIGLSMSNRLKKMGWDIDIIIPVPLHEKRYQERGYNQSQLLAVEIGRECSIDVMDNILIRDRYTESQVLLSRLERIHNVRGVFGVVDGRLVKGKNILLVDDIMTTGATLNECSRVLKDYGAAKVYCITAACPLNIK